MNNGNKKRIFISADIEGTAGAFLWEAGRKGTEEYNRQCRIMTEEVLAVVESLNEKYESCEIMIKDAHATGNNLDITAIPENCSIISGWDDGPYGMMQELDDSYDFAVLIGYHSGAGTGGAPLAHTLNSRKYSSVELNGVKISEFVLSYYTALMTGVPIALVSGDYALCQEIEVYDQSIYTVAVQEGRGGSVITRSPEKVKSLLRETVIGMSEPFLRGEMPDEFHLKIVYYSHSDAVRNSYYPECICTAPKTIEYTTNDFYEILRAFVFI